MSHSLFQWIWISQLFTVPVCFLFLLRTSVQSDIVLLLLLSAVVISPSPFDTLQLCPLLRLPSSQVPSYSPLLHLPPLSFSSRIKLKNLSVRTTSKRCTSLHRCRPWSTSYTLVSVLYSAHAALVINPPPHCRLLSFLVHQSWNEFLDPAETLESTTSSTVGAEKYSTYSHFPPTCSHLHLSVLTDPPGSPHLIRLQCLCA